jgi:prepilin-type N-terminal cleavage/methylation domain-containing protein/prepilin-type processing-associated H-X9-DG protein
MKSKSRVSASRRVVHAFTLVELLVVIGIIAILIAVLLPTLASARRSAAAVKCAAEMKEIWNAYLMYAGEYHDCFPVSEYKDTYSLGVTNYPYNYTLNGQTFVIYPYWQDFVGRYLTKMKVGGAANTTAEQEQARRTVLWGCPSWDVYQNGSIMVHSGYGMNAFPTFTTEHLAATGDNDPPANEMAYYSTGSTVPSHGFFKRSRWSQSSNRCLIADSRFWLVQSRGLSTTAFPPQSTINNINTWTPGVSGQTMIDVYRHGKYPPLNSSIASAFSDKGGVVGYNILYADGHVERAITQEAAYRSTRMRFPG